MHQIVALCENGVKQIAFETNISVKIHPISGLTNKLTHQTDNQNLTEKLIVKDILQSSVRYYLVDSTKGRNTFCQQLNYIL